MLVCRRAASPTYDRLCGHGFSTRGRHDAPVYEVRLGGALPGFAAPVTLAIHEEARTTRDGLPPELAYYDEAAEAWRLLPTTWDGKNQIASAPIQAPGYYALLSGAAAAERVYLPSMWGR